jgi:hypothetical protein
MTDGLIGGWKTDWKPHLLYSDIVDSWARLDWPPTSE